MTLGARAWSFLLASAALVAFVAWLCVRALGPRPGTGFEQRSYRGAACSGLAEVALVREPFAASESGAPADCVEWSAYLSALRKMRFRVEMTSAGGGEVRIDGRVLVADPGPHEVRAQTGTVELSPGTHAVVATSRHEAGASYFRIAALDERDPHDAYITPPIDLDAFHPDEDAARRALVAPQIRDAPSRALLGSLAVTAAGVLAWLALRARRRRDVPFADLVAAAAIFAAALFVRAHALDLEDTCWDEPTYVTAAQHYVHDLLLGDFHTVAWQANLEHPPVTKWLLAFGWVLGGVDGARMIAAIESSLAAAFLFAFGRVAFGRRVGIVAGALAVVLPLWVAHGRVAGHESAVLFFWGGSMLALACWMRSTPGVGPGDRWAAFFCTFSATLGILSRPTVVWLLVLLFFVWLSRARRELARGVLAVPLAAVLGAAAATAIGLLAWPFLWHHPFAQLAKLADHWDRPLGDIEVYMGTLRMPAWHYLLAAFAAQTPVLLLVAAIAGVVVSFRAPSRRGLAAVTLLWLVVPFAQCASKWRIGEGRYVVQAWPALVLFAAIALEAAGRWAAARFERERAHRAVVFVPAAAAVLYTGIALLRTEPFPLDYWNEIVGGTAGVARSHVFETPWWGEGNGAAVRYINVTAPHGAHVRLMLRPPAELPRLRDDLVPVGDDPADIVAVSHFQYVARAPEGCVSEHAVTAAGAPLVEVYRCPRAAPRARR